MKYQKKHRLIALIVSLVMLVGVLPVTAIAAEEDGGEIVALEVWYDNSNTEHAWGAPNAAVEGEPLYVQVEAMYSDGSQGFLSADALDFNVGGFSLQGEAANGEGISKIPMEQFVFTPNTYTLNVEVSLKANPEIKGVCSVDIVEVFLQTVVEGKEDTPNLTLERGKSVQLSYKAYPAGAESKLDWDDWQIDFPDGKIGTDSFISKEGLLYVGWNETEEFFSVFPPIKRLQVNVRYNASTPSYWIERNVPPHSHTEDSGRITKSATCETDGVRSFRCTGCNEELRTETIVKLGHTWNKGVITTPATQKAEGVKTYTCNRCKKTRTEVIPKLKATEIPISGVKLNQTYKSICKGDTFTLTATVVPSNTTFSKEITWSSSNKKIASINSAGKVMGINPGTATITGKTSNGKTAICKVTVVPKGWSYEKNSWYYYQKGQKVKGWIVDGGKWYSLDTATGAMKTGWDWDRTYHGWFYFNASGAMLENTWHYENGNWYFLNSSGFMLENKWGYIGGAWYFFDWGGRMHQNQWIYDGAWYYLGSSGAMLTNTRTPDGYWVDAKGVWR
ncbi:hypothetical protein M2454_003007 [Aequitasia blattaphilus]|uniref:Ig-like domain-containing protein n=1 Tax=Aequitasia blattaphilus TaxID=2949332 RepID=A0ABT1EFH7_9FIRM|nr:Ig-like domain-containing protein [Aequitasia blattaphilus]MCP1103667.1 Ig-like domain-containing protein [Aequitasia blattaphilus]MCR8616307.1 Ig-like domain-containing protein [Aequitasia blattaphilus]